MTARSIAGGRFIAGSMHIEGTEPVNRQSWDVFALIDALGAGDSVIARNESFSEMPGE